jgi:hypothetical protein
MQNRPQMVYSCDGQGHRLNLILAKMGTKEDVEGLRTESRTGRTELSAEMLEGFSAHRRRGSDRSDRRRPRKIRRVLRPSQATAQGDCKSRFEGKCGEAGSPRGTSNIHGRWPGGTRTHWKAPCHGAHPKQSFAATAETTEIGRKRLFRSGLKIAHSGPLAEEPPAPHEVINHSIVRRFLAGC